MRMLILLFLCVASLPLVADQRFNALDADDPLHNEYQRNLCNGWRDELARSNADVYWLHTGNDKRAQSSFAEQRDKYIIDYAVTMAWNDSVKRKYNENCKDL